MEFFFQNLLDSTNVPFLSAFILGLMTAISPCPLATNITAIAYISKDIDNRKKTFTNGLIYTLGRAISYTVLGFILYLGASTFDVASIFQGYGEKLLGPLFVIIGIFMLDVVKIRFPGFGKLTERMEQKSQTGGILNVLLLGIIFALAFCPYSGVLYFGMLIPMTIASVQGLFLPVIFALGTGLPVIIIAWLIAFTVSGVGNFYNKLKIFEFWFRRVVSAVFIIIGSYYIYTLLL